MALEYIWNVSDHSIEFHEDLISRFFSSLINRQTDIQTDTHENIASLSEVKITAAYMCGGGYFVKKNQIVSAAAATATAAAVTTTTNTAAGVTI